MRRLAKLGVGVVAVLAALGALGQALARRRTVGDETSDEFELAAYVGGAQRTCRATALRRGAVRVCFGGVDLDLREATLDPGGTTLELVATWGGISVVVPPTWKVLVEDHAVLGGFDARVTPPEELPEDAPLLRVVVTARMGGVSIRAKGPSDASDGPVHGLEGWAST